jgi:predicted Fe-Mo cluster-binding NifX family protein
MKIAVPVEGENLLIVQRTGQAPYFALFNDAVLESVVPAAQKHEHHHEHSHKDDDDHIAGHGKSLANLQECELMLVRMIGEHMREAVERAGMSIKKIRQKDGECADEAVKSFLAKQEN